MRPDTPMTGASEHRQTSPACLPWPGHRARVRVVQASTSRQHFLFWLIFPEFCRAVEMSGGGWTNHSAGWGHVVPAGQSQRGTGQTMLYEDVQQFVARGLTNICILPGNFTSNLNWSLNSYVYIVYTVIVPWLSWTDTQRPFVWFVYHMLVYFIDVLII